MSRNFAAYSLAQDGTIRHWLACGPVVSRLTGLEKFVSPTGNPHGHQRRWALNYWAYHPEVIQLKKRIYDGIAPFNRQPQALPIVNQPHIDDHVWRYVLAHEDRMIDFSRFNFAPSIMRSWVFAILEAPQEMAVSVEIFTIGPVQLWLNEVLAHQFDATFSYVAPLTVTTTLNLHAGRNRVALHGLMLGWREARLALGMRLPGNPSLTVQIPLGDIDTQQWHAAEVGLAQIRLKQFAFPNLKGFIELDQAAPAPLEVDLSIGIPTTGSPWAQFASEDVPRATARLNLKPGASAELPITAALAQMMAQLPGENTLDLTIRPADDLPLSRTHKVWFSANRFSLQPYGTYDARRREAIEHLSRMDYDVFAAMAAVETGRKTQISSEAVSISCEFMRQRYDCADFYALSLLALLYRYGEHTALKPSDRERIEAEFLGFKYWVDEPNLDGMCYCTENHQILFHVTAYLAGQYWKDSTFSNCGLTGRQQQRRAQARVESWILRRLQGGFSEWDSNAYLTMDVFAMLSLVEFAAGSRLQEMATTLLHKIFFMIASQSFRGAHGSTHGRCYVEGLKSARVENTSSLQRIAWGMGIFNGETRATGMLAMARRYRVPEIVQEIGADTERDLLTRVRSFAAYRPQFDMHSGSWDIRTITQRSADYMLSAAINYRPGEMGVQQHLWQATLSPEAVVFTTYPGNNQEHGHARPNFWAGSVRLPRVVMAHRTLICLYPIEANVGLGFSHAYFPTAMFDEWQIEGAWAFARVGKGYIALWGDGDLALTTAGSHSMQELRSSGRGEAWICHVGQASEDGRFAEFCAKVSQNPPRQHGTEILWREPRGHLLRFSWEGDLFADDQPEDLNTFPHYENAYTRTPLQAKIMELRHNGRSMKLDLLRGRVL